MHGENISFAYGFWSLVVLNIGLFAFFILSFLTPLKKREWRSMGATLAFFVALFTEMYGFPLTIYILTGILGSKYPALNPFSHASGHLWLTFLGGGAAIMAAIHIVSNGLVIIGFFIMGNSWRLIHAAKGGIVTGGPYAYVRHPQYSGLFLIMIGMLIQWPTIITVLMFPVLIFVYYRLSKKEESDMIILCGTEYLSYKEKTPMFIPSLKGGNMLRILMAAFLFCCFSGAAMAQEKIVDNISVDLGIMSWSDIQKGLKEKPTAHSGEYHHRVAQETERMHGGGAKGKYHILVVLKNVKTGEQISKAEVNVEAFAKLGPYKKTITLMPMTIDGFSSFGGYMKLPFKVAHTFTVSFRLNKDEPYKKVEFERDVQ